MGDKFKATLVNISSSVWHFCFFVPDYIKEKYAVGDKRVICKFNDQIKSHAALMPAGDGQFFINFNKELRKKLGVEINDEIHVEIEKDESKYGIPMPEEMEELLKIDDEADKYFHALTPGKQRSLLYVIAKPKNSDIRIKKALVITEFLKLNKGKLDFKALNDAFKNSDY